MSDLISRNTLLNEFNNTGIQITFDLPVEEILGEDVDIDDFTMLVQDAIQSYKALVIDTIKKQPTAYDVDNVIKRLNTLKNEYKERRKNTYCMVTETDSCDSCRAKHYLDARLGAVDCAIEIVKQGGVSDDVCEWQSDYGFISDKYKRETSCGYTFYDLHHAVPFKYCPYCGKKIKIVGD